MLSLTSAPHVGDNERNTRDCKGKAETCIEERNEPFRQDAARPQSNAPSHHDGHDDIALLIEEVPDVFLIFLEATNTLRMLFDQLLKDEQMKHQENNERCEQHPPHHMVMRQRTDADVADVAARHNPDDACNEEEFFSRYLHIADYIRL